MNFEQARFNMVEQQIRPWEVLDGRVLSLLETIHREDFVPVRYRKLAFADISIPLDCGQVMMRPKVEARMLQALELDEDDTVLEIGTGSGFITACLADLAKRVVSVEIFPELHETAALKLKDKGIENVELFVGDVMRGWQPEQAHDVVVVTGDSPAMEACVMKRLDVTEWTQESLFETDLPRLVHAEHAPEFEF